MSKLNIAVPAAIVGLVFAGTAAAASLQPAAGEAPFFNEPVTTVSSVSRADVAAQVAGHLPAAGEQAATASVNEDASMLTRAQVRQQTADAAADIGGFPAASGIQS